MTPLFRPAVAFEVKECSSLFEGRVDEAGCILAVGFWYSDARLFIGIILLMGYS
jgi:hypothetical protein